VARTHGEAVLARTDAVNFTTHPELAEEVFGPYALLIRASSSRGERAAAPV
jgi:hypothetical protein